jgi:selenocysteine lyase/cysteine desulfurase
LLMVLSRRKFLIGSGTLVALNAEPTEIPLTGNTTMGLALVYHGLPLKPGDEVLTTTHDHYSHHESIRLAVERVGAGMRKIPRMNEERDTGPNDAARMTPGGFTAYEHQWAMGAAFRFHRQIGRPRVAERIRQLNDRCKAGLAAIPDLTLHTPRDPELSAGIIAFEVDRVAPKVVVKKLLERRIIASTSPYKVSYARLAPSLVNTPEEVDAALAAVRAIART